MIVYDKYSFNTSREIDPNGFLRVEMSNITKAQIRPYLGREIPSYKDFNLDPNKIYNVLCPKEELEKAAKTFNNLPLTSEHIEVDVDDVPKEKIVGSLGDHASFDGTYLKNNLIVYDKKDIDKIMSGKKKELSCGYRYTPVRESGEYEGQHYDFKMTDIIGNHVALVKQGRAGRDVMVADTSKGLLETIKEKILAVFDNDLVGDEFVESEHPRAENGQFTSKGGSSGSSSLKDDKDVDNYWQGTGSKESQEAGNVKVMEKQLHDLRGMLKEAMGNSSSEGKERVGYLKKDIENLEKEIGKQKAGGKSEEQLIKEFQETGKEISKMLENEERLSRESKFSEEGKNAYEKHSKKLKELNAKKEDLDKQIKAVGSGKKDISKEKAEEYSKWWNGLSEQDKKDAIMGLADKDPKIKELLGEKLYKNITGDSKLDKPEQEKVGVVMKEFKEGELKSGSGEKVTDPKQAIAIALSEADKVAKDEIPEKAGKPEKAGEENALQQGEKKMAEEVKEEVKTKKVETTPAEEKPVEDACSKDEEIKKKSEEEVIEDEKEKDLKGKKQEAFAEGVKYGEKKEKEEPKKLDSEHESEGTKKADEEKKEMAKDSDLVMDADALRAEGREQAMADFKARDCARKSVRSIVGDVDIFAFDSAEDIYKFACKEAGMNLDEIVSFKDAFTGLQAGKAKLALDASPVSGSNEECFKNIRIA